MNSIYSYTVNDVKLLSVEQMLQHNVEATLKKTDTIYLSIENIDYLPEKIKRLNYSYTADIIKSSLGSVTSMLRSSKLKVEFCKNTANTTIQAKQLERINSILSDTISKTSADKYTLTSLLALLTLNIYNKISILLRQTDTKDLKLWDIIYSKGCITVENLRKLINPRLRHIYSLYELSYTSWGTEFSYKTTRNNCYYVEGYCSNTERYYYNQEILMFPLPQLIGTYLLHKYKGIPRPAAINTACENQQEHIINTSGNLTNIKILQALYSTGQLERGKTKFSKGTLGKIASATSFTEMPTIGKYDFNIPSHIMAELFVSAAPDLTTDIEIGTILRKMYAALGNMNTFTATMLTGNSVTTLCGHFFKTGTNNYVNLLFRALITVLTSFTAKNQWYEIGSIIDAVMYHNALLGNDFVIPYDSDNGLNRVKMCNDGGYLPVSLYKERIHDVFLNEMILSLGVIGVLDFQVDDSNKIKALSLTAIGDWLLKNKPVNQFPVEMEESDIDSEMEFDDTTMLILIKNDKSPYVPFIESIAQKISSNRYHITEKSLIKKCNSKEDVHLIYNQFCKLMKLVSPAFEHLRDKALECFDVVRKNNIKLYTILDVSPSNRELHQLLTNNEDLKQLCLRVEGCRIAIESTRLDELQHKLKQLGFPCNLS